MDKHIDPEWTIENDLLSVHVGINTRLWICRQEKTYPIAIYLGKKHTQQFMKEKWWLALPKEQIYYESRKRCIPIFFNEPIYGIAIETIPLIQPDKCRKHGGNSGGKAL